MEILRAAALLVALCTAAGARAGGDEPPPADATLAAVTGRVAEAAGRPVGIDVTLDGRSGPWRLVCGRPSEPGGKPFEIDRSALAASEFGADFCALARETGTGAEIVEFDIGMTDMPMIDWVGRHGLPPAILDGGTVPGN